MKDNFDMLLASCIHDMKNAISLILNSVDHLNTDCTKDTVRHLANLNYEASRLNNDLIHLLGVYRLGQDHLHVVIDEHDIWEVVQEQFLKNSSLMEKYGIDVSIKGEEDEQWYFDPELIASIINNVLVNTVRYTKSKIQISLYHKDDFLCIEICDDGIGYPDNMISSPGTTEQNLDFRNGSTKLGLYFASKIASMHKNGEKAGCISLQNGGELGGGVFRLMLP